MPSQVKTAITSEPWKVERNSAPLLTLPEAEGNRGTRNTEEDRSKNVGTIQEMEEDIWFDELDRVVSNQTERSGLMVKDDDGGEVAIIRDE